MVRAKSLTAAAGTLTANSRPIRVKTRITGTAHKAEITTSLDGRVPSGTIASRIREVTLNTANSVNLISFIDHACR